MYVHIFNNSSALACPYLSGFHAILPYFYRYIESVLQEESSLCLMLRSSRTEPPALAAALAAADAAIAQLVCPPPPLDPDLLTEGT